MLLDWEERGTRHKLLVFKVGSEGPGHTELVGGEWATVELWT